MRARNFIIQILGAKKLTRRWLAYKIGVTESYVSIMLKGKRIITHEMFTLICEALKINEAHIIFDEGGEPVGVDRCIMCGEVIPEGRFVCSTCESEPKVSLVTEHCKKCAYYCTFDGNRGTCDYILIEKHSRPCVAGDDCTEYRPRNKK